MKLIIDIPEEVYEICKQMYANGDARCAEWHIANGTPYEERPQGDLADEVWKLYKKHQSHLATHVIEFGYELKDLLGKYQKGGEEE